MEFPELNRIARQQRGLFTRAQAGAAGATPRQIRTRLANGTWRGVQPAVLATAAADLGDPLTLARAAQLAVPGSVIYGPTAGLFWGLGVATDQTHLAVSRRVRTRLAGVRVARLRIDRPDRQLFEGATVTSRERSVFDCLRLVPEPVALDLLDRALLRGWITLPALGERANAYAGASGAKRVVAMVSQVAAGSRFAAERLAAQLLRRAGLRDFAANVPIFDPDGLVGVGDIVFDRQRVVVELDGMAFHVAPEAFQRDRQRQNRLVAAGWCVLRFTWYDLTRRPHYVVATVRGMLRQPAGRG